MHLHFSSSASHFLSTAAWCMILACDGFPKHNCTEWSHFSYSTCVHGNFFYTSKIVSSIKLCIHHNNLKWYIYVPKVQQKYYHLLISCLQRSIVYFVCKSLWWGCHNCYPYYPKDNPRTDSSNVEVKSYSCMFNCNVMFTTCFFLLSLYRERNYK